MSLDKALTWFIRFWMGLVVILNIIAISGFILVAPTVWAGLAKIQDVYSPFNIWNWLAEFVLLTPALGAMTWRERRRAASDQATPKPAHSTPRGFFSGTPAEQTKGPEKAVQQSRGAARGAGAMSPRTAKFTQLALTIALTFVVGAQGVFRAINPEPGPLQHTLTLGFQAHPVAAVLGSLLPVVFLSPLTYWVSGRILRRYTSKPNVCVRCGSRVPESANFCQHCGQEALRLL